MQVKTTAVIQAIVIAIVAIIIQAHLIADHQMEITHQVHMDLDGL